MRKKLFLMSNTYYLILFLISYLYIPSICSNQQSLLRKQSKSQYHTQYQSANHLNDINLNSQQQFYKHYNDEYNDEYSIANANIDDYNYELYENQNDDDQDYDDYYDDEEEDELSDYKLDFHEYRLICIMLMIGSKMKNWQYNTYLMIVRII